MTTRFMILKSSQKRTYYNIEGMSMWIIDKCHLNFDDIVDGIEEIKFISLIFLVTPQQQLA